MALDAAQSLLEHEGPAGLSARKISSQIGYTVGTLYLVFQNLDDLIFQLNLRTLKRLREEIEQVAQAVTEPLASLKAMADAYTDFAQANVHCWRMLYEHPYVQVSSVFEDYQAVIPRATWNFSVEEHKAIHWH